MHPSEVNRLDEEALDGVLREYGGGEELAARFRLGRCPLHCSVVTHLDGINLALDLPGLTADDGASNDGPRDTASASDGRLGGEEDVRDVLVLAEEGQVEEDLDGLSVGRHDDQLGDTAVERLCRG